MMMRMSGISCTAMWISRADSAPNEEVITRSGPNWATDHLTMSRGDCRSNSWLNVATSSSSAVAVCRVLMGSQLQFYAVVIEDHAVVIEDDVPRAVPGCGP